MGSFVYDLVKPASKRDTEQLTLERDTNARLKKLEIAIQAANSGDLKEIDKYINEIEYSKRYSTYAIFYSDGRKTIYYTPISNNNRLVSFNSDVKLTTVGKNSVCFDRLPVKIKDAGFNTNLFSNICVGQGDQFGMTVHAFQFFGTAVDIEPLAISGRRAGWIVGLLP